VFDFPPVRLPDPFNRGLYFQVTFLIWVLDQLLLEKLVPSPNMFSNPREESLNLGFSSNLLSLTWLPGLPLLVRF
ncbi:hypothetical protein KGY79_07055, partial [Candidatus Bipolaricaulota bacterium]|nr:hypothetical protein [Candidatus Bipolaricaulota bacterium]